MTDEVECSGCQRPIALNAKSENKQQVCCGRFYCTLRCLRDNHISGRCFRCIDCDQVAARYRHSCCKGAFCSVICGQKHNSGSCQPKVDSVSEDEVRDLDEDSLDSDLEADLRHSEGMLSKEMINNMESNKELERFLMSESAREAFADIDSAADRVGMLAGYLRDADFSRVVDSMLTDLGYPSSKLR